MDQILAKLNELKNMPTKNKLAIALMLILSIAVIIRYYPSSSDSGMELSSSAEKVVEQAPNSSAQDSQNSAQQPKLSKEEINIAKQTIAVLEKYPQGIYLTQVIKDSDIQSLIAAAQISYTNLQKVDNVWKVSGTSDAMNKLEDFINSSLKYGLQATKVDFKLVNEVWNFNIELQSINE